MRAEAISLPHLEKEMSSSAQAVSAVSSDAQDVNPASWVDEHGNCLFRFAVMRVRDESLAEDLVQETFVSAIASLASYGGRASERTWLTGILKHKIIDHYRRNSREIQIDEDEELAAVGHFFERPDAWDGHWATNLQPVDPEQKPDEVLERDEFWKVMDKCLSAMPDHIAKVFALREIDGMTSDEICETLQLSSSNFWVIMHRARMQLRRCIEIKWFTKAI